MYGSVLQGRAISVWECSIRDSYKCLELFYKRGL